MLLTISQHPKTNLEFVKKSNSSHQATNIKPYPVISFELNLTPPLNLPSSTTPPQLLEKQHHHLHPPKKMQIRKTKNNHLLTKGSQPQNLTLTPWPPAPLPGYQQPPNTPSSPNQGAICRAAIHRHGDKGTKRRQTRHFALDPGGWIRAPWVFFAGGVGLPRGLPHEGWESIGKFGVIPRWPCSSNERFLVLFVVLSGFFQALTSFARAPSIWFLR